MRLLSWKALQERGHVYTRRHTERLVKASKFPAPIKVGDHRIAWIEEEVDAHYVRLAAQRGLKDAAESLNT
jgi:prophage regulatory protein